MAAVNTLPFEYLIRGAALEYLDGSQHAQAIEARDAELEDYLGRTGTTRWTALQFVAGWANYGSGWNIAQARKVGDEVQLRGLVTHPGSVSGSVAMMTIPIGYRLPAVQMFPCLASQFGFPQQESMRVDVGPDGSFTLQALHSAPVTYLSLDIIRYSTVT